MSGFSPEEGVREERLLSALEQVSPNFEDRVLG
jgi:hypothetical protein